MFATQELDYHHIITTYCDINNISLTAEISALIDTIILQDHDKIITLHGQGYIRYYFDQLIRGEISIEQFMTLGDIENTIEDQINPHRYREEHPATITQAQQTIYPVDHNTLLIVDPLFALSLPTPPSSVTLIQLPYMS